MARPKKTITPIKEKRIMFRVTDDLYDVIANEAAFAKMTVSEYCRKVCTDKRLIVRKEKVFDNPELLSALSNLGKIGSNIVDIEANIKAQQNHFYAQKVKVGNLQQMSKTLAFLQENGIGTLEELEQILSSTQSDFDEKRISLKATEDRLKTVNLLIKNSGQYLAHKQIYGKYLKAKNKKKFREDHESEIILYETARKELKQLTNGEKIPSLKQLRSEKEKLTHKKNQEYEDYSFSRAKLRELQTIQSNVNTILGKEQIQEKNSPEL